jgi:NADPH-dependent 2,4-dienoyl-CoA reductase/sulfur reductase-like enzyme/rhodanese-related sulfurtransferase
VFQGDKFVSYRSQNPKNVVIVGGVAGGASAAARLRRLDESANIIVLERGQHVSFANCGLPYYLGGDITDHDQIVLQTPESLYERFRLDVRVLSEVTHIHRDQRTVTVHNLQTQVTYTLPYDALILSPGAAPLRPPIAGLDQPGHYTLRNVADMDAIDHWITQHQVTTVVVGGGGYIGLEVAEQLRHRGLAVTLVEGNPQVMAPLDVEMAAWLHQTLRQHGVQLILSDRISHFDPPTQGTQASTVVLTSGQRLPADLVVMGLGVRPEIKLAQDAGLTIGQLGGIQVNDTLQTSDPAIWAVGDAIEVMHPLTQKPALIALAGPANRQGRIAAANIAGHPQTFGGTLGTAVLRLFDQTAAVTGLNEKQLRTMGTSYQAVHLHPAQHATYFPGAARMALKVLFHEATGQVLGAQAVGTDGVDKRIDVISTAIQAGMTIQQLAELELSYAPPYSSAKDPVNLAGMIGSNILAGLLSQAQWYDLDHLDTTTTLLLDVRDSDEVQTAPLLPSSLNIPLAQLRERLHELPLGKTIITSCATGQRSYYAARLLTQHGFTAKNLSGAHRTWQAVQQDRQAKNLADAPALSSV